MSVNNADKIKSPALSALLVLGAGCLWGFMGLLVRSTDSLGLDSMDICFLRALVTSAVMLPLLLLFDRPALKVRLKDLWCFAGTGIVSMSFFNFCYFKTIMLTSLSVAAVLLYTAPVFVVLMSAPLFGEKLNSRKLLAALAAFLGCAFVSGIVGGAGRLSLGGILFGLGSGIGYALYSIFGRYALERGYSSATISFYTFVFALIPTGLFADSGRALSALGGGAEEFFLLSGLILMVTLIPYLLYTKGLQGLGKRHRLHPGLHRAGGGYPGGAVYLFGNAGPLEHLRHLPGALIHPADKPPQPGEEQPGLRALSLYVYLFMTAE